MKLVRTPCIFALIVVVTALLTPMASASQAEFFLVDASPTGIGLGETIVLNLTIKNLGTEQALRVGASLDPDDTSPIDPIGPVKTQIEKAEGGYPASSFMAVNQAEEVLLSYHVKAKPNTTAGIYKVPLKLEWKKLADETTYSQTLYAGIAVVESPFFSLSMKTLEPNVLLPGSQNTLTITIQNDGLETVKDIVFTWSSTSNNIEPIGGTDRIYIPSLSVSQELKLPIDVIVNENATAGIHPITVSLSYYDLLGNQKTSSFKSSLNIPKNPEQEIDVKFGPVSLKPGEKSEVYYEISNLQDTTLRDVVLTWTAEDNALLPQSSNRIVIPTLNPGETVKAPVQVVAGTVLGVYPLTVAVSYYDQLNNQHKKTLNVGIEIGGDTDFQVSLQQASETTTSFSIGNIGVTPATAVVIKIPQQNGFIVVDPAEIFLGNLDPGDFSVAGFQITSIGQRGTPLQIEVSYTDTTGKRLTINKEIAMGGGSGQNINRTFAPGQRAGAQGFQRGGGNQLGAAGNSDQNYITYGVGGLAIILIAALSLKFLRRKRE